MSHNPNLAVTKYDIAICECLCPFKIYTLKSNTMVLLAEALGGAEVMRVELS